MCGIAGRAARTPFDPGEAAVLAERLQSRLVKRGPDGGGVHFDRDLLLVHRRLAIIDLTDAGRQPLWNEDGTVCVIVNGEIYNFEELRHWLASRGHLFRSRSDSEVLVHLYEESGIDGLCERVEGMFAFALWDARRRDLFLVRDRLGIKPLALAEHQDGVTFASTIGAVLADDAVPRDLRDDALLAVFEWGFVPTPWSVIRAIRHLSPGCWARIRDGRVVEERRWWIDAPSDTVGTEEGLRQVLDASVRSHLVADVPVGVLLSAGIDSGIVTALAARATAPRTIEAWTVSHPGCAEDEYPDALRAGMAAGIPVNEVRLGTQGLDERGFDDVVAGMDEPLAVSSLVGLHRMFAAIAPERRVVLSGDGGDELFGGYEWHVGLPVVPTWARTGAFRAFSPVLAPFASAPGRLGTAGTVAAHIRRHPASVYLDKLRLPSASESAALGIANGESPIAAAATEAWDRFAERPLLERMLAVDRATALVDEMLAKVDAASMAYSVEARVPLLADAMVAYAKSLAAEHKRSGVAGKVCLRRWYRELLVPDLADRRKTGFTSPVGSWLAGEAADALHEHARLGFELIDAGTTDWSPRLVFAAAVLGRWMETHLRNAPRLPADVLGVAPS